MVTGRREKNHITVKNTFFVDEMKGALFILVYETISPQQVRRPDNRQVLAVHVGDVAEGC